MELVLQIATIASPIIGVVAIIVALRISKKSSEEASHQLRKLEDMLDTFVAVENVKLVSIMQENEKALNKLEPQIEELQNRLLVTESGGITRIEKIENISNKEKLQIDLQLLLKKKKEFELERSLIISYLQKVKNNKDI